MAVTSMKQLLEAGVHFGHQTKRWNPKMAKYIYAARNDIHIIDLQISVEKVEEAYAFIRQVASEGKDILFVGTKNRRRTQSSRKRNVAECTTSTKDGSAVRSPTSKPLNLVSTGSTNSIRWKSSASSIFFQKRSHRSQSRTRPT